MHSARSLLLAAAIVCASTATLGKDGPAFAPKAEAQAIVCKYLTDGVTAAYNYCAENNLSFSQCASDLGSKGVEWAKGAWAATKRVKAAFSAVQGAWNNWKLLDNPIEGGKAVYAAVQNAAAALWAAVKEGASDLYDGLSDMAKQAMGAAQKMMSDIKEEADKTFQNVKNKVMG